MRSLFLQTKKVATRHEIKRSAETIKLSQTHSCKVSLVATRHEIKKSMETIKSPQTHSCKVSLLTFFSKKVSYFVRNFLNRRGINIPPCTLRAIK